MKQTALWILAALAVTGCTGQPAFDPNTTEVQAVDGKLFNVPSGAIPSPHLATKKEIDFFKKSGVANCHYGDILWEAPSVQQRIDDAIRTGNPDLHKVLAKEGKIGCASPLKK
jgi:hypothetical protein